MLAQAERQIQQPNIAVVVNGEEQCGAAVAKVLRSVTISAKRRDRIPIGMAPYFRSGQAGRRAERQTWLRCRDGHP